MRYKHGMWRCVLCLVLCLVLVGSELPVSAKQAAVIFNLENRHIVNAMILDGEEVVA